MPSTFRLTLYIFSCWLVLSLYISYISEWWKVETRPDKSVHKYESVTVSNESYRVNGKLGISWDQFISTKAVGFRSPRQELSITRSTIAHMTICQSEVERNLSTPRLDADDFKWCQWALSVDGGQVKVGKSYGKLAASERAKYEQLQCNTVAQGTNPSCDDIWGEKLVSFWKANVMPELCASSSSSSPGQYTSRVRCIESVVRHRLCTFEHVMFNFSLMTRHPRESHTDTRAFAKGFLASHCASERTDIEYFPFYSPSVDTKHTRCSYVIPEPVLAFSHDDLRNLGHSMSDIMNVWLMLWLTGLTAHSHEVTFLNIDSFRGGHNFDDDLFDFGLHYEKTFARVLKASDFAHDNGTVCFKKLVVQPKPLILFTWDGWWQDMPCSFVGPSSLYQRWNLQVRDKYGLLGEEHMVTNKKMRLLFISRRKASSEDSVGLSSYYSSRVISNEAEVLAALQAIPDLEVVHIDLAALSFEEQVRLISSVGVLVGMHGAGIANSMHMPVGSRYCCGVIEIFPQGEFEAIKGYGNMARKMGHRYDSFVALAGGHDPREGTPVDPALLKERVVAMLRTLVDKPQMSCLLPKVVSDAYFDSYPASVY